MYLGKIQIILSLAIWYADKNLQGTTWVILRLGDKYIWLLRYQEEWGKGYMSRLSHGCWKVSSIAAHGSGIDRKSVV